MPFSRPLLAAILCLWGVAIQAATTPEGYPPPGEYQIDSDSTRTTRFNGGTMARQQKVVGATGDTTVVDSNSMVPGPPQTTRIKGTGPVRWCIAPYGNNLPPAALRPFVCDTRSATAGAAGSSFSADCNASQLDNTWRRIDDQTWEHTLRVTEANHVSNTANKSNTTDAMRAVYERVKGSMTPAERAQAELELKSMPSAQQQAGAMAEIEAAMQAQIRNGTPQEVAFAKQQLAALRSGGQSVSGVGGGAGGGAGVGAGGGAGSGAVTQVRERWTRIAQACKPTR